MPEADNRLASARIEIRRVTSVGRRPPRPADRRRISSLPLALESIVAELGEADRQERIELLIDFAKNLPALPERLERLKDAEHRVEECQSPVFLFVEPDGPRLAIHADAPIEAPTVRGFVAILVEGLKGATVEDVLSIRGDLIERIGLPEILGMLRVRGLAGVLARLKREATRAVVDRESRDPRAEFQG